MRGLNMQLTANEQVTAQADLPPGTTGATWETDNPTLLALTPAPDGLSCVIAARGPSGGTRVVVSARADLGAGLTRVMGILHVHVDGAVAEVPIACDKPQEQ
jgi:hypothetical protein